MSWLNDNQEAKELNEAWAAAKDKPAPYYKHEHYNEWLAGVLVSFLILGFILYCCRKGIIDYFKMPKGENPGRYYGMMLVVIGLASPVALPFFVPWHESSLISGTLIAAGVIITIIEMVRCQ
jgi:hypothetical protein